MKIKKIYYIENENQMSLLGKEIAKQLHFGDVVALIGDLGTGKTTLAKAIGAALGVEDLMRSPTFAIANEYALDGGRLIHADVYRLSDQEELYAIGFEDYLTNNNIVMIEWANLIRDFLQEESGAAVWIELSYHERGRRLNICAEEKFINDLEAHYDFGY